MTPIPLASAHKSHFLQTIFILLCSLWDSSLIINMEETASYRRQSHKLVACLLPVRPPQYLLAHSKFR